MQSSLMVDSQKSHQKNSAPHSSQASSSAFALRPFAPSVEGNATTPVADVSSANPASLDFAHAPSNVATNLSMFNPSDQPSTPQHHTLSIGASGNPQEPGRDRSPQSHVQRLFAPSSLQLAESGGGRSLPIQPKLTIGAPHDPYEQETDRVAEQVVQRIRFEETGGLTPGKGTPTQPDPTLQPKSLEEDELQMKPVVSIARPKTIQRANGETQQPVDVEARKTTVASFKRLYDGTLTGLAAALAAVPVGEGLLSDEFLLRILKEAFEENWFKAKACLTTDQWPGVENPPHHAISIELMKAMVNMRGRMWDKFVKKVQPLIIGEVMRVRNISDQFTDISNPKNSLRENFGLKDAVGSESVTSDIDLSGMGANTEIGVALINKEFPTYFGVSVEPGTLFDINVYSSDWMFGGKEVRGEAGVFTVKPTSESEVLTGQSLSKQNQKKKDDQNEVWSMVKIRRNMTAVDWNIYIASVLGGISDVAQINEMKRKFALVDAEYKTFHNTVQAEVDKMEKALDHEENRQKSAFADKKGKDHLGEEAMEMSASNRQYEAIILRVKALRLQIKQLHDANAPRAQVERLLLDLHNEISRGLTYANEVYATEGAVLHTVYGKQGAVKKLQKLKGGEDKSEFMQSNEITGVKYLLSKEQCLQSVNENVGDTLHSINHNQHDPQYAVYRAGKYVDRLCEAVRELIGSEAAITIRAYPKLLEIGTKSTEEKSGAAGKDPTAVHHPSSFFSKFNKADLGKVKAWAMDLGSKTTAIYKKTLP